MPKKILSGTVISNKQNKTVIVKVTRQVKHPLYKKIIRKSKNYFAHDEENNFNIGDKVKIKESKPFSKKKTWQVLNEDINPKKINKKNSKVEVASQ